MKKEELHHIDFTANNSKKKETAACCHSSGAIHYYHTKWRSRTTTCCAYKGLTNTEITYISTSFEQPSASSNMLLLSTSGARYPGVPHKSAMKKKYTYDLTAKRHKPIAELALQVHMATMSVLFSFSTCTAAHHP